MGSLNNWVHLTIFEDNHADILEILWDEFKSIHRGHIAKL